MTSFVQVFFFSILSLYYVVSLLGDTKIVKIKTEASNIMRHKKTPKLTVHSHTKSYLIELEKKKHKGVVAIPCHDR